MSINVTVDEIREVLSNVKATQDSVPHVSKWITQRKQEIDNITRVWFDLYKTGNKAFLDCNFKKLKKMYKGKLKKIY